MTTPKLGRPKGASRLNPGDEMTLAKVADMILATPDMKPTTAMHRIGINDETVEHRLRRKWNVGGERHLAEARQRQQQRVNAGRPRPSAHDIAMAIHRLPAAELQRIGEAARLANDVLGRQFGRGLQNFLNNHRSTVEKVGEAARKFNNSGLKAAIDFAANNQNTTLEAALRGEDIFKVAPLGSTLPPRKD